MELPKSKKGVSAPRDVHIKLFSNVIKSLHANGTCLSGIPQIRHSRGFKACPRQGGDWNPDDYALNPLDSRFRGNDVDRDSRLRALHKCHARADFL